MVHLPITLLLSMVVGNTGNAVTGQVVLQAHSPAHQAVAYLEGKAKGTPLPPVTVDQRGKAFIPHVTVVTVGTPIKFPNNDSVFHNVFAYHDAKKLDLGM